MPVRDLQSVSVLVAALTYRRPGDLADLLPAIAEQASRSSASTSVVIVDNDPDAGAPHQVDTFGRGIGYLHAARPGIAAARNVALEGATNFDLLVFIDDDERPSEEWLQSLLDTWARSEPAAVVGPVVSSCAAEPDRWVAAGRFFDRRRLPTGTETDVAATNNLLLDLRVVRRLGLKFDDRFGLTGGSDRLFTRQLHPGGGRLACCDEAVIPDVVPASRLTRAWILRRAYPSGNTLTLTSLVLAGSGGGRVVERVRAASGGLPRVAAGAGAIALGAVTSRLDRQARDMRTAAGGAGMLAGVVGAAYVEYRR